MAPPGGSPSRTATTPPPRAPIDPKIFIPPDFDQIAAKNGWHAEADGRVYALINGQKSYVPPWAVWQASSSGIGPDGQLTADGLAHRLPGSDPQSAWNFMYASGGPFVNHSQWDSSNGTYQGSIDWGTLIGTIAAGALIGGGVIGAVGSGGGGGGAAATTGTLEGTAAGPGAATTAAGLGTAPIGAETGATIGGLSSSALPGAVAAPTVADLAGTGSAIAGTDLAASGLGTAATTSTTSTLLGNLTSPQVLATIASGALALYGANQAAGAQTDAASIIAQANTAAAKLAADASVQSAQIQAQSTANALDFEKSAYGSQVDRYNTNQSQLAPYVGAGDAAVTRLSQLLGLGTPPAYVAPPPLTFPATTVPTGTTTPTAPTGPQSPYSTGDAAPVSTASPASAPTQAAPVSPANVSGASSANPGTIAAGTNRQAVVNRMPLAPDPTAQTVNGFAGSGPQMVTLRAPTGEITQKPASELQHWLSLGATQVNGINPGVQPGTASATGSGTYGIGA